MMLMQAYGRAIELEPGRLFSLSQSGMVLLGLGSHPETRAVLQKALQADPTHVPALFTAAQLALATAHYRLAQGAPGELLVCLPADRFARAHWWSYRW